MSWSACRAARGRLASKWHDTCLRSRGYTAVARAMGPAVQSLLACMGAVRVASNRVHVCRSAAGMAMKGQWSSG